MRNPIGAPVPYQRARYAANDLRYDAAQPLQTREDSERFHRAAFRTESIAFRALGRLCAQYRKDTEAADDLREAADRLRAIAATLDVAADTYPAGGLDVVRKARHDLANISTFLRFFPNGDE